MHTILFNSNLMLNFAKILMFLIKIIMNRMNRDRNIFFYFDNSISVLFYVMSHFFNFFF